LIAHPAEFLGGDEHLRTRRRQNVAEFLAAVEVHDRHHHGPEERRRPERRGGFHPVGQLQCHHVTGSDAALVQAPREPPRHRLDIAESACKRPELRMHAESGVGVGREPTRDEVTKGLGCPPALLLIAFDQLSRDVSHLKSRHLHSVAMLFSIHENANIAVGE
jgi:hypothetical protein